MDITAKDVKIDGGYKDSATGSTQSSINADTFSSGKAGIVNIVTDTLKLTNGGIISVDTSAEGNAGDINITSKNILIDGGFESSDGNFLSEISSQTSYTPNDPKDGDKAGKGGNVKIDTDSLSLSNGGLISAGTSGMGDAGDIKITAKTISIDGSFESSDGYTSSQISSNTEYFDSSNNGVKGGDGGIVTLDTDTLTLSKGGQILSMTNGGGNAGTVSVTAKNVSIHDVVDGSNDYYPSMISSQADSGSSGNAGSVKLDVESLTLSNGGQISSANYGKKGDAGIVSVKAKDITIQDTIEYNNALYSSIITSRVTNSSGNAGTVTIDTESINLSNGGQISSANTGTGNAGDINLTVAGKLEMRNATISTESKNADGGNITINAAHLAGLIDSSITATVGGGVQTTGGNIRINSSDVALIDSQVIANAYKGKGGSIGITAETYLADSASTVSATSTLGINGEVSIDSLPIDLNGLITPLPIGFADISGLLDNDCETRYKHRKASSLVVRGSDALPVQPGDLWPSQVMDQ